MPVLILLPTVNSVIWDPLSAAAFDQDNEVKQPNLPVACPVKYVVQAETQFGKDLPNSVFFLGSTVLSWSEMWCSPPR